MRILEMAGVHEGDAKPLRRRLQHQGPRIEMVDRQRLQVGQPRRRAPGAERIGHIAMDQGGQARELFRSHDRVRAFAQVPRPDHINLIAIQPPRVQRWVDLARERNHRVQPFAQPRQAVLRSVDIQVQFGVFGAQFGQAREQPLRGVERQDAKAQPQHVGVAGHDLDRVGQLVERRGNLLQQAVAIGIEHDRLMPPFEQRASDEALQRLNATTERRRRQSEFLRCSLDRPRPCDLHERLDCGQWRQSPHGGMASSLMVALSCAAHQNTVSSKANISRVQKKSTDCRKRNRNRFFRTCNMERGAAHRGCLSGILS